MYKLLKINGVTLPDPDGDYSVTQEDKFNEYEGEDGTVTVEVIRQGVISLSVSFDVLTEAKYSEIVNALQLVSTVELFDPKEREPKTITAKITGIKSKKVWYKHSTSLWTLSFSVDEL